jgi:hypothetical protein
MRTSLLRDASDDDDDGRDEPEIDAPWCCEVRTTRVCYGLTQESIQIMIKCSQCGIENQMAAQFCESCGLSFESIQAELNEAYQEEAELLRRQAKNASSWLMVIAGLQGASALLYSFAAPGQASFLLIVAGIMAVLFLGLAVWARRNPAAASITTLVLLGSLWLFEAIGDPKAVFNGIIIKIILIVVLTRAIKAGIRYRELQREGRVS